MNLRRPILAVLAFAVLVATYLWDLDRTERSRLRTIQRQQVLFHDPARAVELRFQNDGGTVVLRRLAPESPWRIVEPIALPANESIVFAYLENLRGARRQAEFSPDSREAIGISDASPSVTLLSRNANQSIETFTVRFGSQPVQHGPVHAMIDGESTAFTVSEWLYRQSLKTLADLRDKRIVPRTLGSATHLEVESVRGKLSIRRTSSTATDWFMAGEGGRPIPADRVLIDRMVGTLTDAQFLEIADNPTSSTIDLGLAPPALTFSADGATILEVGMRIPNREQFVARDQAGNIGVVARSALAELFRPAAEWTSKRFVWFQPEDIQQVEASSGNARLSLLREPRGWVFPEMRGVPVREEKVAEYLKAITSLSAVRLARSSVPEADLADYGIVEASFNLTVTDRNGIQQGFRFGRTDTTEGMTFVYRKQDSSLWRMDFAGQARVFVFNRDLEERRLVPELTARTGRFEIEVGGQIVLVERRGAAWMGTFPGERPALVPPNVLNGFMESFEEMERSAEMALMGRRDAAAVFRLYEPGADQPYATISLINRNRSTRAGVFLADGVIVEVDADQFDAFDEQMAQLLVAIKGSAEAAKTGQLNW